jgi:hypothetical protein
MDRDQFVLARKTFLVLFIIESCFFRGSSATAAVTRRGTRTMTRKQTPRRFLLLLLLLILLHSQVAGATITHSLLHFYDSVPSILFVGHVC